MPRILRNPIIRDEEMLGVAEVHARAAISSVRNLTRSETCGMQSVERLNSVSSASWVSCQNRSGLSDIAASSGGSYGARYQKPVGYPPILGVPLD